MNARLQCKEFVCPDDDKWYRVLVVRWIPKWESHAVLCYEARLADPTANQKVAYYINRMEDECFSASVEDVDDWIKRSPKRARTAVVDDGGDDDDDDDEEEDEPEEDSDAADDGDDDDSDYCDDSE